MTDRVLKEGTTSVRYPQDVTQKSESSDQAVRGVRLTLSEKSSEGRYYLNLALGFCSDLIL